MDVLFNHFKIPSLLFFPEPHGTHQSISEALEAVKRLAPKETYFVHMSHHAGLHEEAEKLLPPHVHYAYDGLEISL